MREELATTAAPAEPAADAVYGLTVEEVAARLKVARSTVYAHWREWGGYKIGTGPRAPIRFDSTTLPSAGVRRTQTRRTPADPPGGGERRGGRRLLSDAPRIFRPAGFDV
jgi:hypothetical protein